jgi:hypothetical protein
VLVAESSAERASPFRPAHPTIATASAAQAGIGEDHGSPTIPACAARLDTLEQRGMAGSPGFNNTATRDSFGRKGSQQLQLLCADVHVDERQSGFIAAGARQARDDTRAHQIIRGCDHGNNGS